MAGKRLPLRPPPFSPHQHGPIHTWSAQCKATPFSAQRAWVKPPLDVGNDAWCPLSMRVILATANARASVLAATSIPFLR